VQGLHLGIVHTSKCGVLWVERNIISHKDQLAPNARAEARRDNPNV
jgi:hypothetical protein